MEWLSILSSALLIVAYLIGVICQWMTYKNLKRELKEAHIIIHNIDELKQSLNRAFEGVWNVSGSFEKFQKLDAHHTSGGVAVLTWNEARNHYDVNYAYSVEQASTQCNTVTAICQGYSFYINESDENSAEIRLQMHITHRTSQSGSHAYSTSFKLESQEVIFTNHRATTIQFLFDTGETKGQIDFKR